MKDSVKQAMIAVFCRRKSCQIYGVTTENIYCMWLTPSSDIENSAAIVVGLLVAWSWAVVVREYGFVRRRKEGCARVRGYLY